MSHTTTPKTPDRDPIACTVYKGNRLSESYLFLARESGQESIPSELLDRFGTLEAVVELELTPTTTLARAKAEEVIAAIESEGFYLQLPPADPRVGYADAD